MVEMLIRTERDDYTGGEAVEGQVVLRLDEPLPVRGISLSSRGYEHARLMTGWGHNLTNSSEMHAIFEDQRILFGKPKLVLSEVVADVLKGVFSRDHYELIREGSHEYPFTIELPPGLPGDYLSPSGAEIRYELAAEIDLPLKADLRATKALTIHEQHPRSHRQVSGEAHKSFPFDSTSHIELDLALDRNLFHPGEVGSCSIAVRNHSKRTIEHTRLKIRQFEILWPDGARHINTYDYLVAQQSDQAISPGAQEQLQMEFTVPAGAFASIHTGRLIRVGYEVVACLEVPWSTGIEASVAVEIVEDPGHPSGQLP